VGLVNTFEMLVTFLFLVTVSLMTLALLPRINSRGNVMLANLAGGFSWLAKKRAKVLIASAATVFALSACSPEAPPPVAPEKAEPVAEISPEHEKMITDLAARLEQNPEDGRGWSMLARTYAVSKRYPDAVNAYEKAENLIEDDAVMLVDYADILAMVNGKTFKGKPM